MKSVVRDLKYALRLLVKTPGFAVIAILSLGLGIGANTTVFTLIHTVFFRSIPVSNPDELLFVFTKDEKNNAAQNGFGLVPVSRLNFDDFRERNRSFSGLASLLAVQMSLAHNHEPELLNGQLVSGNFFDVVGIQAAQGRTFIAEEDGAPGAHPVVVLSHDFWSRRFAADRSMIGKTIKLNGLEFTVIGIGPEGFRGIQNVGSTDFWVPRAMYRQVLNGLFLEWYDSRRALTHAVLGRLKPGVTRLQADGEIQAIAKQLQEEYPKENEARSAASVPLLEAQLPPNLRPLFTTAGAVLMAIAAIVLLIACANLANLLLARATTRSREMAVRLSLGAARSQLVRQLLTESVVLSVLGGVVALLIARWGLDYLWSFRPPFFPENALDLSFQPTVLFFSFLISLATGVLFGLVPAIQSTRPALADAMKSRGQAGTGASGLRLRNALVVAQIALSVVALIGTGLFLRSLAGIQSVDPGFDVDHTLVMSLNPGSLGYREENSREYFRQALERVRSVPTVEGAAFATNPPLAGVFLRTTYAEGQASTADSASGRLTMTTSITPQYFATMKIPLIKGRDFVDSDQPNGQPVVIINETMARRFWPNEEALGKRIHFFNEENRLREIVGVVKDSKYANVGEDPTAFIYLPLSQNFSSAATLHVRVTGSPEQVVGQIRKEVQALDSNIPIVNILTMRQTINVSLWAARMAVSLLGVFGVLALTLAAIGIYGLMSYNVAQRAQEIGVRIAVGAQKSDVLRMVLRQSFLLVAVGIALGVVGALGLGRAASNLLFGISPTDLTTYAGISALLLVVAMAASYLPARRGTRVDPLIALRSE